MSSYRRVAQTEDTTPSSDASEFSSGATSSRSRGERLEDKFIALGWVIVAVMLARWTEFFGVLWSNEVVNRKLLKISFMGCLLVITIFLYLTVYLPRIKGLSDPSVWGVYCPKVLPVMCVVGVSTYLVLIRALWPLYGFMAPLISGTEIMGMLMALHFVPTFGIC
mmetsp:Transcript_3003/g.6250  ORF Transcript_3003/g.6250 Transcript_3003/m.6250 type:complete len:165 (-) Transcript_3003:402-896(-)